MGCVFSKSDSDAKNTLLKYQPRFSAKDLLEELENGWYIAGGEVSKSVMSHPGRIWTCLTDSSRFHAPTFYYGVVKSCEGFRGFPKDGSYGTVTVLEKRIDALALEYGIKERLNKANGYNFHSSQSALEGQVLFYDYDFKKVDTETRVEQTFDLADQREICGFAFLPAPLRYFPIGKNFLETSGPLEPYLLFASPQEVIMHVEVDGIELEDHDVMDSKMNKITSCFLKWRVGSNMQCMTNIPLFITARKDKAMKWPQNDLAVTCLRKFSKLFESLTVGEHVIKIWFQFSYCTEQMNALGSIYHLTKDKSLQHVSWDYPMEHRFDVGYLFKVANSSLILRDPCPDKVNLSVVLCSGLFKIIVPDKSDLYMNMYLFYGFNQQDNSVDGRSRQSKHDKGSESQQSKHEKCSGSRQSKHEKGSEAEEFDDVINRI